MEKNVDNRSLLIQIPEKIVAEQLGWLPGKHNTREGAVRAYILRNPEIIENGLAVGNLVAINVWLNKWEDDKNLCKRKREVDIVFEKDGIYYLIETKRDRKYSRGMEQLGDMVDCFKSDFEKHKQDYGGFIPVLVTTTDKIDRIKKEWIEP